jgi:hypothetical protein
LLVSTNHENRRKISVYINLARATYYFGLMYPYSANPHRGIQNSLAVAEDVIHLYVEAKEFYNLSSWPDAAAEKLKTAFPNLRKAIIEDDYLDIRMITELPGYLAPVVVEWAQGLYFDGRHGR